MTRQLSADIAVPSRCYLAERPRLGRGRAAAALGRHQPWARPRVRPGYRRAHPVRGRRGATGPPSRARTRSPVGAIGLTITGGLVLALVDGFALGPGQPDASGAYPLTRVEGFRVDKPMTRFNDGKPSPWGDFWAGTSPWREGGQACALYKLSPDRQVTELLGGVGLSNGLDWSDDRTRFFYVDSVSGGVDVCTCDPATLTR